MKRKILLSGLIILISMTSIAQFKGTVLNSETNTPISNANITIDDQQGTITNSKGEFSVDITSFPVILTISHLSYYHQEIVLNTELQSGLTIHLVPKTMDIDEVVISVDRIRRFFEKNNFYVLDFEFLGDKICVTGFDNRRLSQGRTIVVEETGDTLYTVAVDRPESFIKDAFGNIHLITKDSIFQLYDENNDLELLYPTHRKDVPLEFYQLEIVHEAKFLFKVISNNGQTHEYLLIDTVNQTREVLKTIIDTKLEYHPYRPANYAGTARSMSGRAGVRDMTKEMMEMYRDQSERYFYSTLIIHQAIHSQFFKNGNSFILFDHINNRIIHYDTEFKAIKTIKSKFPKHKQRRKQVIQDLLSGKFYWVYYQGSRVLLGEIDTNSGEIINTIETPHFPFIENIKIRNGIIWFTYQPRLGETTRSLFKMN